MNSTKCINYYDIHVVPNFACKIKNAYVPIFLLYSFLINIYIYIYSRAFLMSKIILYLDRYCIPYFLLKSLVCGSG